MSPVRPPTLAELPSVPGRSGWPWTEATPPAPRVRTDGTPWPRISIVTPSYGQGAFIEETIRSILLQGYPDLQYVVIDGASCDGTRAVLERYAPWIDHWVSEPDRGQSHAINKGLVRADGEIFAWLNSDDVYLPGTLQRIAEVLTDRSIAWVAGDCRWRADGEPGERVAPAVDAPLAAWFGESQIQQPASFWSRALHDQHGVPDETLHYVMDQELFLRFRLGGVRARHVPEELAVLRLHPTSKTMSSVRRFRAESAEKVAPRHLGALPLDQRVQARRLLAEKMLRSAREDLAAGAYVACGRDLLRGLRWDATAAVRVVASYVARRGGKGPR